MSLHGEGNGSQRVERATSIYVQPHKLVYNQEEERDENRTQAMGIKRSCAVKLTRWASCWSGDW